MKRAGLAAALVAMVALAMAEEAVAEPSAGAAPPVRLLALSDAFDPAVIEQFTQANGTPVLVDGAPSNAGVEAALKSANARYDLVLLPADALGDRLPPSLFQRLAAASVPEAATVDPRLVAALPSAAAGRVIPFDWFPEGFVVNTAKLTTADLPSDPGAGWDLFGHPDQLREAAACGLGVPDRPQDLFAIGLGPIPGGRVPNVLERRRGLSILTQLRIQAHPASEAERADGFVQGDYCAVLLPAPAAALVVERARAADPAITPRFVLAPGGSRPTVEVLGVPASAPNRDGAIRLLRFLLGRDVSAANARWGHVAPAVGAAAGEALADPSLLDRLSAPPAASDAMLDRAIEAEWRRGALR